MDGTSTHVVMNHSLMTFAATLITLCNKPRDISTFFIYYCYQINENISNIILHCCMNHIPQNQGILNMFDGHVTQLTNQLWENIVCCSSFDLLLQCRAGQIHESHRYIFAFLKDTPFDLCQSTTQMLYGILSQKVHHQDSNIRQHLTLLASMTWAWCVNHCTN